MSSLTWSSSTSPWEEAWGGAEGDTRPRGQTSGSWSPYQGQGKSGCKSEFETEKHGCDFRETLVTGQCNKRDVFYSRS